MRKLLLITLLFVSVEAFCQIPYKTKEERTTQRAKEVNLHSKDYYLRRAGTLGILSNTLIISSATTLSVMTLSTFKKKNVNDDSVKIIAYGFSIAGIVCQISAFNCINKAGKTTNTVGLNVSPAGASVAVTF